MISSLGSRLFISPSPGLARRLGRISPAPGIEQFELAKLLEKLLYEVTSRFPVNPVHYNAARRGAISIESTVDVQYSSSSHHS
jgi:hypothetical protein